VHPTQVLNVVRFMRSGTGRSLLTPGVSDDEVADLLKMETQLVNLKRQVHGQSVPTARATPSQLTTTGKWTLGGLPELTKAATSHTSRLLSMVPSHKLMPPTATAVVQLAQDLSVATVAMLLTSLPPQRPNSLRTTSLINVTGVANPARRCTYGQCDKPSCPGNVLIRDGEEEFTWLLSHHKTKSRKQLIPAQRLCKETQACPVLLRCLETVFTWSHAIRVDSYGLLDKPAQHFAFHTTQDGLRIDSSSTMGRLVDQSLAKVSPVAHQGFSPHLSRATARMLS
jgi:hypothetical protein